MTVHIITEKVEVRSRILVNAPPGERQQNVIALAMQEHQRIRKERGLYELPTDLRIDPPFYQEGRRWVVDVVSTQVTSFTAR